MKPITSVFDTFFEAIETLVTFNSKDRDLCKKYFKPCHFYKGDIMVKEGETATHFNFVIEGLLRKYMYDENGVEITTDFSHTPGVFNCYDEFISQKPSKEYIEALTDGILLSINHRHFTTMMNESDAAKQYTIKLMQIMLKNSQDRVYDMGYRSATERYLKFTHENPYIIDNAHLMHISTYLGVRPQSLSRIRSKKMKVV
jgi:CRP-like cAMP-binding protein